jgi:subtilisin-like proprotein convertase family protein
VFPSGNGGDVGEGSNNDGYANSVYVICVGAVDIQGRPSSFSETGACLVAVAPSGNGPNTCDGGSPRIITTDLTNNMGYNKTGAVCELCDIDYTRNFNGTSASVPQVSGVAALMIQANPRLGWRDVKEILLRSGTKVGALDGGWTTNAVGIAHHPAFGGGLVNAGAAVELATNWFNLNAMESFVLQTNGLGAWGDIPDADTNGVTFTLTETNKGFRVESVALTVNITHPRRGDLLISMISPSGVESVLETPHDPSTADYSWTFTTVRNWGEEAVGTWQIKVADVVSNEVGNVESVHLQFFGSSVAGLSMQMAGSGDRNLQLRCSAPGWSPQNCELLSSTNLTGWTLMTNYTMAHGDITNYTDTLPSDTMRYYRARVAP